MELDGRSLDGRRLETTVCVVGAGPCGLALAASLDAAHVPTIVLESGGSAPERAVDRLNRGTVRGGRYAGLARTRARGIGGTATVWNSTVGGQPGAKYVPLDPSDLTADPHWPLEWSELAAWYAEADALCRLGGFDFARTHCEPDAEPLQFDGGVLESRVYRLGAASVFTRERPDVLRSSPNATLCHHATVLELLPDKYGQRVNEAVVGAVDGGTFRVAAETWVLAAGAVENARILLLTAERAQARLVAPIKDTIGRWFMEHPRDSSQVLLPSAQFAEHVRFYETRTTPDGATVLGRLAVPEEARRLHDLPNASLTFLPYLPQRLVHRRWRHPRLRSLRGRPRDGAAYLLLLNLEQAPHPENRIVLGVRRDGFGLRRPELCWRWRVDDQARLERLRALVARELEAAGLGRVVRTTQRRPNPNAHHHAGTTRMGDTADSSVVDDHCLVHGTENLFAVGSSVFPTAGYANPTFTVVALALRLGDHLTRSLGRPAGTDAVPIRYPHDNSASPRHLPSP